MKEYYKEPELTKETLKDGWMKTGDIGRLDQEGNLYLEGRIKNIIISGGENILPGEIEHCLLEHEAVVEAAVVPKENKILQEVPYAFIVKHKDYPHISTMDIIKFCRKYISSQKIPREIQFISELPRLKNSKIDRNALKEIANECTED